MTTYEEGMNVGQLILELRKLPSAARVSLAVMESETEPRETIVCLMVEHNGGGTVVLTAPLDLGGLLSQGEVS